MAKKKFTHFNCSGKIYIAGNPQTVQSLLGVIQSCYPHSKFSSLKQLPGRDVFYREVDISVSKLRRVQL